MFFLTKRKLPEGLDGQKLASFAGPWVGFFENVA